EAARRVYTDDSMTANRSSDQGYVLGLNPEPMVIRAVPLAEVLTDSNDKSLLLVLGELMGADGDHVRLKLAQDVTPVRCPGPQLRDPIGDIPLLFLGSVRYDYLRAFLDHPKAARRQ